MPVLISSAILQGIDAELVSVEVACGRAGETKWDFVGFPAAVGKGTVKRVLTALRSSGYRVPEAGLVIKLTPFVPAKDAPFLDLAVAIGVLAALGQLTPACLADWLIVGELNESGATRPVRGALAMARLAQSRGKRGLLLPAVSAEEAALVEGVEVYQVDSIERALSFLKNDLALRPIDSGAARFMATTPQTEGVLDFSEIKGQAALCRAVEIAVAGRHPLLIVGAPGAGKAMVAQRIASVMPPPTFEELLEIIATYSAAGRTVNGELSRGTRPFRAPHHTVSRATLLGEIALARRGVLFLDELPEFKRATLGGLEKALRGGAVTLVAAMSPCPCGYFGDTRHECRCTPAQRVRYRARVGAQLLGLMDIIVEAPSLSLGELRTENPGEPSALIRARVESARVIQERRFSGTKTAGNSLMTREQTRKHCPVSAETAAILRDACAQTLRVARTIADLAFSESIEVSHLVEAIKYRGLG